MTAEKPRKRVGVLISGRGSNLAALIAASRAPAYPAEIVKVISNVPGAAGLHNAGEAGIATETIDHRDFKDREAFDRALTHALERSGVEILCNAGFMRLHSREFVAHWRGRQLNIHPSLLPAFRGLHPQRQALDAGVRVSGCTVHFVNEAADEGPIIAQVPVPVQVSDSEASLSDRILEAEHQLYPLALRLVASGEAWLEDGRVMFRSDVAPTFRVVTAAP
jgi:phosphoribosylglycinamide formyltransferase-1